MIKPVPKRTFVYGAALALAIGGIGAGLSVLHGTAAEGPMVEIPIFEVDPFWPRPLPDDWLLGMTIGVSVDDQDNVWIAHRGSATLHNNEKGAELNPPIARCCRSAPPVLEFNPRRSHDPCLGRSGAELRVAGVNARQSPSTYKGNVWLGGNGARDAQVLKFNKEGKFLMQSGHYGKNAGSNDTENFGRVALIYVDAKANEAYIADGYRNKRVAVIDADTGKMKRYWGAYGNEPDDADRDPIIPRWRSQQFRNPVHCVVMFE